ncbi:hypothetical protein MPNT_10410 [Candidatus Methylacidithermus pantelleriae]|uniref:Uncharacterized protein n=1 Tax=Candidatus Methylacidithermus pantelleriae TaxID=2744239 RepID=A0A8J2BR40_9BACT|nr:hypothetical protein MPNT_10410 [Candidatus Methylacidithermus pantelleriae]
MTVGFPREALVWLHTLEEKKLCTRDVPTDGKDPSPSKQPPASTSRSLANLPGKEALLPSLTS